MDDTPKAQDDRADDDLAALEAADPADAPEVADRIADRLQAMLETSEEQAS